MSCVTCEGEHEHHGPAKYTYQPNPFKLDPTTLGLVIFLVSEVALFGAFFLFYGHTRLIKALRVAAARLRDPRRRDVVQHR